MDGRAFEEHGFVELLEANTYVLNRVGLHRYYLYIADRYGEVGARAARRAARLHRRTG